MSEGSPGRFFPIDLAEDPDRMRVLYAPFRDKSINPAGYESKMKTWENALLSFLQTQKRATFDLNSALEAFARSDGEKPVCLETVVADLAARGIVLPAESYQSNLAAENSRSWLGWGVDLVIKRPISWVLSSAMGSGATIDPKALFVWPKAAEEMARRLRDRCREILDDRTSEVDSALEWEVLFGKCADVTDDEGTFSILISILRKWGFLDVTMVQLAQGKERILVSRIDTALSSSVVASPGRPPTRIKKELSERDKTVLQLEATAGELVRRIERLHAEATEHKDVARRYVAKGIRPLALNALKRKRACEHRLENRERSLEQVEALISKLRDVDDDRMVLSAYKEAAAALSNSLADGDLTAENVDDTVDELKELLERQGEVAAALGMELGGDNDDDNELAEELERILDESDEELRLPDVPVLSARLPDVPDSECQDGESVAAMLEKMGLSPPQKSVKQIAS